MMIPKIPEKILDAASSFIRKYGVNKLQYKGRYDNNEVWTFNLPKNKMTGFPIVFLFSKGCAKRIYGMEAVNLLLSMS